MDPLIYRYPSRRSVVYGQRGMVCTSQPLAAQAGLEILKQGGNAVDAAIATAIAMTVMEPVSCGVGGDAFALVWMKNKLYGLNASGPAPKGVSAEELRAAGNETVPLRGWAPVTVPGQPSGWIKLSRRFGKLPFAVLFGPAIRYAREGHPVAPVISWQWSNQYRLFSKFTDPCFAHWGETFAPKGRAPLAGEIWGSPALARTLEELAQSECESFYRGPLAAKIDAFSRQTGGWLRAEDLAEYHAQWVEPISVRYKGYDVWEIPPNGHGLVVLMALNILRNDTFAYRDNAEAYHRQIEAMKLTFADGQQYIADPATMSQSVESLLAPSYADARRRTIADTAAMPQAGDPSSGGTIYLCTADGDGNMVSYIQSNYKGFGSGVVIPDTGIALHDRGANFNLTPTHPNCLAPGKKPYHTIIPGFLSKNGNAVGPFGVMGAFMQPQGQAQVVMNTVDFHMNPQEALDAPRWQWVGGMNIEVERGFPYAITEELVRKGHTIRVAPDSLSFGRGQIIWRNDQGVLMGATDPRADGSVAAW